MKVFVQGQGAVTLTQGDFVGGGGEGNVYVKGATAFKVYTDPKRAIPLGKISELSGILLPTVIKPERALLDAKGNPIGYTMNFVQDAMPLCQTFTRAFREREGLGHDTVTALVQKLRGGVVEVHRAGVLIVDLNEMNLLVDRQFKHVYFIDVDSYQTRSYPATAIMPSVRDWSRPLGDFNEGSDWFSFACVAFQMFCGIHPYKGKHPTVHGMEERMKARISIFDPSVSVPKAAYPVDVIPAAYRAWLKAVLQDGLRSEPPTGDLGQVVVLVQVGPTVGGSSLDIAEIVAFSETIFGYAENAGSAVAWTTGGVYLDGRRVRDALPTGARAVFSPKMNRGVLGWIERGTLCIYDTVARSEYNTQIRADELAVADNHLMVRSRDRILRVSLTDVASKVVSSSVVAANCLEHATRLFDGCAIQNMLGSTFASLFTATAAHQVRLAALDKHRIVEARYEGRVLMVLATQGGRYDRFTFRFAEDHATHTVVVVQDVAAAAPNFLVLDSGVCVHLTEDDKIEVSAVSSDKVRSVESPTLGNDMRLVKHGGRVAFVRGNKVFSMRMR